MIHGHSHHLNCKSSSRFIRWSIDRHTSSKTREKYQPNIKLVPNIHHSVIIEQD